MIVKRKTVYDAGSCNFCNRGTLKENADGLLYPYESVIEFCREGNGIKPNICKPCLNELIEKASKEFATP